MDALFNDMFGICCTAQQLDGKTSLLNNQGASKAERKSRRGYVPERRDYWQGSTSFPRPSFSLEQNRGSVVVSETFEVDESSLESKTPNISQSSHNTIINGNGFAAVKSYREEESISSVTWSRCEPKIVIWPGRSLSAEEDNPPKLVITGQEVSSVASAAEYPSRSSWKSNGSEQSTQMHCSNDAIDWADSRSSLHGSASSTALCQVLLIYRSDPHSPCDDAFELTLRLARAGDHRPPEQPRQQHLQHPPSPQQRRL